MRRQDQHILFEELGQRELLKAPPPIKAWMAATVGAVYSMLTEVWAG